MDRLGVYIQGFEHFSKKINFGPGRVGLIFLLLFSSVSYAMQNKLTLAEQHLNTNPASKDLELGTLILYFDRKPAIQVQEGKNQFTFFFPDVIAEASETQKMIKNINVSKPRNYTINIEKSLKPKGLKIIISADPRLVGISYAHFPSIKMQSGVIFHMHNKELLSKINDLSHKDVLSIAHLKPKVVIDCGHGGTDTGAIGCASLQEKDVILPIGLEVARILKSSGIETVLTRDRDRTISLGERTTLANNIGAVAFVSIHANSSPDKSAHGIETFCVAGTSFEHSGIALESNQKNVVDSFFLSRCTASQILADELHENLIVHLNKKKFPYADRKVKNAASQVLLGAHMPAVLCEVGFVTNWAESRLLQQPNYRNTIAQGISNGILAFLNLKNV